MEVKDLKKLRKPLSCKWRIQSLFPDKNNPTHCIMIPYVDAREVQQILDDVCGIENWQNRFFESKGKQFCEIGIKINNEWIWKGDCGTETQTEKEKGETSDAFKRAGVQWGINREAYNYDVVKLPAKQYNGKFYPSDGINFLKGNALHDYCNTKAKVKELEELFEEENKVLNE